MTTSGGQQGRGCRERERIPLATPASPAAFGVSTTATTTRAVPRPLASRRSAETRSPKAQVRTLHGHHAGPLDAPVRQRPRCPRAGRVRPAGCVRRPRSPRGQPTLRWLRISAGRFTARTWQRMTLSKSGEHPAGPPSARSGKARSSAAAYCRVTMITSRLRGPWTPSTRLSSISLVAEGPLINVSGRLGSSRVRPSGTVATMRSAVTTQT